MRRCLQAALVVAFILSLGAAGACKKDEPAGGGEAAKPTAPATGEAAKATPAEEKAAPAAEEPKEEPKPAEHADRSKWPKDCQKLSGCVDALKKGPDSPTKSRVLPTWESMPEMIDANPAEWELGCKTLLEGIAADEGVPDACK
jgi:hypothetical protein